MGIINKTTEKINTLLDKVEGFPDEITVGKTPVFEVGLVTTVSSGSPADVNIRLKGADDNGNPIYIIDFEIPKGKDGATTDPEGNPVTVDWDSVLNKPEWIKSETKPSYTSEEVGALPNTTKFKTINGESILGEGNIEIQEGTGEGVGKNYIGYKNAEIFNDYDNNIAAGAHAHAEGRETNATGPRAHAEGYLTRVFAADAHAEGRETWCIGSGGHSEGYLGVTMGDCSHTEGGVQQSFAVDEERSLLNDEETIRNFLSKYSFQKTDESTGKYYWKLAENIKELYYLHGAFGLSCHCEGVNNIVCDKAGHVEGYDNIAGDCIPGMEQDIISYAPHAEGVSNRIESFLTAPHVGGGYNHIKSGNYTFAHGYKLIVENDYETSFGRYNSSYINGKKVLFSYGIGNESSRKNAFSVLEDGTFVCDYIQTLLDGFENEIKILQEKIYNQQNQLDEVIELLQSGSFIEKKAFVLNGKLIFTEYITATVNDSTLTINDSTVKVENNVLIIK